MPNYLEYYDDEGYLLDKVGPSFRITGRIAPFDFLTILVWKANRAKRFHIDRLGRIGGSFGAAVAKIGRDIHRAKSDKERLGILMNEWGFYLPTASAILTILYPENYTVYDTLVCTELQLSYRPWRRFRDELWDEYRSFVRRVCEAAPEGLTLRECDRFLIGRSNWKSVKEDCK